MRRNIIRNLANGKPVIFSSTNKFSRKVSKYLDFYYLIIDNEDYFILHESQDEYLFKNENFIVSSNPEAELKKILNGRIPYVYGEEINFIPTEKIDLSHIFRKPFDEEIPTIENGMRLLKDSFKNSINNISENMREYEIMAIFDYNIEKTGMLGFSYPTVVLTGQRTSIPLGKTSDKIFIKGENIIVDTSPYYNNYLLSYSETFFTEFNEEHEKVWKIYEMMYENLEQYLKPGVECSKIDLYLREFLSRYNLNFPHFSGYPLGEFTKPYCYPNSEDVLERNMVFVLVPAIYIKGKFGIRNKKIILITDDDFKLIE